MKKELNNDPYHKRTGTRNFPKSTFSQISPKFPNFLKNSAYQFCSTCSANLSSAAVLFLYWVMWRMLSITFLSVLSGKFLNEFECLDTLMSKLMLRLIWSVRVLIGCYFPRRVISEIEFVWAELLKWQSVCYSASPKVVANVRCYNLLISFYSVRNSEDKGTFMGSSRNKLLVTCIFNSPLDYTVRKLY